MKLLESIPQFSLLLFVLFCFWIHLITLLIIILPRCRVALGVELFPPIIELSPPPHVELSLQ